MRTVSSGDLLFIFHHLDLCLEHALSTDDRSGAVLFYYADAELGGDTMTTKTTGGYWLEIQSPCGQRRWPITWATKKATHTSTNTADSEIWSLIGAQELGLRKEVIPLLQQMEVSLNRLVLLRGLEDNTACIAAVKRGYSPAMRHLQRRPTGQEVKLRPNPCCSQNQNPRAGKPPPCWRSGR